MLQVEVVSPILPLACHAADSRVPCYQYRSLGWRQPVSGLLSKAPWLVCLTCSLPNAVHQPSAVSPVLHCKVTTETNPPCSTATGAMTAC